MYPDRPERVTPLTDVTIHIKLSPTLPKEGVWKIEPKSK